MKVNQYAIKIKLRYEETKTYKLAVNKFVHGNLESCVIDALFLSSGDYQQIFKTSQMLDGLVGEGAVIQRGEKSESVDFSVPHSYLMFERSDNYTSCAYFYLSVPENSLVKSVLANISGF